MKHVPTYIIAAAIALGCALAQDKRDEEIKELRERIAKIEEREGEKSYYLSSTGIRHNRTCKYFKANPKFMCTKKEGRACQICGG